jgi:hypothetical protein
LPPTAFFASHYSRSFMEFTPESQEAEEVVTPESLALVVL